MTGNIIYLLMHFCIRNNTEKMISTSNKREKKARVEEGGGENSVIHEQTIDIARLQIFACTKKCFRVNTLFSRSKM